jgi:uncharacterized protein YndB with AHSA1/START domain
MAEKSFRLSSHDGSFFKAGDTVGVYFERILDHPVSQVWSALTEPEHLAKWLAPAVIRGGKGGTISLRLTGRVMGGKITEWREETLLEYVWSPAGPSSLCLNDPSMRWELLSEGKDRTRLVFTHRHVPGSQLVDAAKGWHYHLDMLEAALGGQPMPHNVVELWDEITREATARYIAAARLFSFQTFYGIGLCGLHRPESYGEHGDYHGECAGAEEDPRTYGRAVGKSFQPAVHRIPG